MKTYVALAEIWRATVATEAAPLLAAAGVAINTKVLMAGGDFSRPYREVRNASARAARVAAARPFEDVVRDVRDSIPSMSRWRRP